MAATSFDAASRPLLGDADREDSEATARPWYGHYSRAEVQGFLGSRKKHYAILGFVAIDVAAILFNILAELIACDKGEENQPWVGELNEALHVVGLVISSLFLVELLLCVLAFGFKYFADWFHCFDALVIVVSFAVDVVAHGIAEEIGSLVVILRLWRFVKIVEELSVGAAERMEELDAELEKLREENRVMSLQLAKNGGRPVDEEAATGS